MELGQNIGKLWSTNKIVIVTEVDNVRSVYANAFEFGQCVFGKRGISTP